MSNGQANEMPKVEIVDEVGSQTAAAASKAAGRMLDEVAGSATTNSQSEKDANIINMSPLEGAGEAIGRGAESINKLMDNAREGSSVLDSIKEKFEQSDKNSENGEIFEGMKRADDLGKLTGKLMKEKFEREVTDKDRERAKEKLSDQLGEFVDEGTRNQVLGLENALIEGDLEAFAKGLKELKPEDRKKFIEGVNKQFDKAEVLGGVDLAMDGSGNVLVYEEHGYTALSINPETGESSVKPIDVQPDGSVVLKPGEVINRDAGDVMSGIADEATRSLTRKNYRDFPIIKPRPSKPDHWRVKPLPHFYKDGDGGSKFILEGKHGSTIHQRAKELEELQQRD